MDASYTANDLEYFYVRYAIDGQDTPFAEGYCQGVDAKILLLDVGTFKPFCGATVLVSDVIVTLQDNEEGQCYLHSMIHEGDVLMRDMVQAYIPTGEAEGQVVFGADEYPGLINTLLRYPGLVTPPAGAKMFPLPAGWAFGWF
jgi:hypothetical protein